MARPYWKGFIRLSLVSCAVSLHRATTSKERISFHLLDPKTHNRVEMRPFDAETGKAATRRDLVRGYEFEKGRYVVVEPGELEALQVESTRTIDLQRFVDADQIDPVYFADYHYLAPDGKMADETFRVICEAMRRAGKAAIGRIVLTTREHPILLAPYDRGMLVTTLRSAAEVVSDAGIFAEIGAGALDDEMIDLAARLIKQRSGKFDAKALTGDRYQQALHELVARKVRGEKPTAPKPAAPSSGNVINLMDALRRSVKAGGNKATSAQTTPKKRRKPARPAARKAS